MPNFYHFALFISDSEHYIIQSKFTLGVPFWPFLKLEF